MALVTDKHMRGQRPFMVSQELLMKVENFFSQKKGAATVRDKIQKTKADKVIIKLINGK